ncbi:MULTISPECIES: DUF6274 family protein [Streptomyces]|uniref:Uncharacterized protein n=2 Tax=Streptomyces TaxID=1883 RepID=A0A2U9P3P6_STRAS|nr:DUF6274 family protein [Streptomyces actuosus]AWT44132.1 hypothetical protein DMT42_18660 [Streptomyces actuosus]MBM4820716.1 hypothetical protein [Streptomyces actuosus]
MAASVRHETRALLRAHLSAASSYGHLTRHCPICRHLLRLAMDAPPQTQQTQQRPQTPQAPQTPQSAPAAEGAAEDQGH